MKKISLSTLKKGLSRDEMRSVKGAGCGCTGCCTGFCGTGCFCTRLQYCVPT